MNPAKFVAALGLLAILAAFLIYTSMLSGQALPPEPLPPPPPIKTAAKTTPGPVAPAVPVAFTQSAQCRDCHLTIYDEWKKDEHANAWTEDVFKFFTKDYTVVECLACHAPKPMLEIGLASNEPKLRDAFRNDGVDCITCHLKGGKTYGTLGSKAVCGGILEPALKMSQACYHCHATHNLFKEFLASPQHKQGQTCQDCHMEKVTRPVALNGPIRETRKHFIHGGGHDADALKKALKIDLAVEKGELVVTVTNIGAAHGVPGEINNRIVRLEVSVLIKKGKEVVEGKETDILEEVLARQAIFRAPPRMARDKVKSTQIMPGEPRVLRYELLDYEGKPIPHGKALGSLSYKLQESTLNSDATPMTKTELEF